MPDAHGDSIASSPVTIDDVESAERARAETTAALALAGREVKKLRKQRSYIIIRLLKARFTRWWALPVREFCRATTTVGGGYVVGVLTAFSICLVTASIVGLPPLLAAAVALGAASIVAWHGLALFRPSKDELESSVSVIEAGQLKVSSRLQRAEETVSAISERVVETEREAHDVRQRFESTLNRLRSSHWQGMVGIEFERFLADVFGEWGYAVKTTKVSGDQGADLILVKDDLRVAAQLKGTPGTTVGTKAVQEAHAGKSFYGCNTSAVITNSQFSTGAIELAEKVNCHLIDKSGIAELLHGNIPF